jgi:hypothetical protein
MSKLALLFLLIYFGGIAVTLIVDATWGFYLYQLVYLLYPESRWWSYDIPSFSYSFILVIFILISFALKYKKFSDNKFFNVPHTKWLILILLLYYLTYFIAVNEAYHAKTVYEVTKLIIIIAIGYKLIDTARKLSISLWAYIIGSGYISYEAYRLGRNAFGRVEGIGTATTDDANGIAAILAPTICILIFFAWRGNIFIRITSVVFSGLIVNGLVLLNSRGAFLGLIVGCGFFIMNMLFSEIQHTKQRFSAILIILIGFFGAIYLTDDTFWKRMETLTELQTNQRVSGSHRIHMWIATFDMIADHPFGVGAAGFQKLSQFYVPEHLFFGNQTAKAVHSTWFQSLAELGIPGPLVLFLLLLSSFLITTRTKNHLKDTKDSHHYFLVVSIEGALITFIVTGLFIDAFRSEIFYWLIMYTACIGNIFYIKARFDKGDYNNK